MLRKYLQSLLDSTEGLLAIVITDRDGAVICKVCSRENPELSQRSSYIAPFNAASEQATKLGLGVNKSIICFYDKFQVVSKNNGVVHFHFVGTEKGNTGDFMTLDQELLKLVPNLTELFNDVCNQVQGET